MRPVAERQEKGQNLSPRSANGAKRVRNLHVVLIKPSKYDDDGYVIRHFRGILPSNTLACLYSLTEDVRKRESVGEQVEIRTHVLDETVQKIPVRKFERLERKPGNKVIIGLVGVQTNQFPRASDLALMFRDVGIDVIIGGFHVSGMLALSGEVPEDIRAMMDKGICFVSGEVENHWARILRNAIDGELKPLYNFLDDPPDLGNQPVPIVNKRYLRWFVFPDFGTIDCGRGCPFSCEFCTVINVHGRKVRCRDPELIGEAIRKNDRAGIRFYFFTDDNFARNKRWEEIFDILIRLRTEEGIKIEFMMQVDVLSYKIENFIRKAREAGCTNVFIGMESVNPKNLEDAGKNQNTVEDYAELIAAWHKVGISTHVGYIIGFPHDTAESIREDVRTLIDKVKVELASFFMMTPLPGSTDHLRLVRSGSYLDSDYNNFDSFHATYSHGNLSKEEWENGYRYAWEAFYSFENMKAILERGNEHQRYWDMIWKFFWYKGSVMIENSHPMVTGFFRLKDRKGRRSGYEVQSRWVHLKMRTSENVRLVVDMIRLWWELQELWLQTRPQTSFETRFIREWKHIRDSVTGRLTVFEWKRSGFRYFRPLLRSLQTVNVFSLKGITSRRDLNQYWSHARSCLSSGKIHRIRPVKMVTNAFRDMRISFHFIRSIIEGLKRNAGIKRLQPGIRKEGNRPAVIALSLPKRFDGLKKAIESFLQDLGVDILNLDGSSGESEGVDIGNLESKEETKRVVRSYLESLKGKADFVLLPLAGGMEGFHGNFVAGLSEIANDVRDRLSALPRIIHFPIMESDSQNLRKSLIRLGLCFTDDTYRVIAASEKAVSRV